MSKSTIGEQKTGSKLKSFSAGIGNFSIQYNYACAGIVSVIMTSASDQIGPDIIPDFPEPVWVHYSLMASIFAGSVLGMLVMGYAADAFGPRKAMLFTLCLNIIGAVGCAIPHGSASNVYLGIVFFRFVLGAGLGGIYPIAALTASSTSESPEAVSKKVAWCFFWQGPGALTPYLVALLLLQLPSRPGITDLQFRILYAIGAIPPAIVMLLTALQPEDKIVERSNEPDPVSHGWVLLGTAGGWFLYDVAYYGTMIFIPMIIKAVFGDVHTLTSVCFHSLFLSAMSVVGVLIHMCAMHYRSAKTLCVLGFYFMGILFLILAFVTSHIKSSVLLCVLYAMLFTSLSFGTGVSTYVLPTLVFPEKNRGKYHGISSAAAKIGAVVGTLLFQPLLELGGLELVMCVQASCCFFGAILVQRFVPRAH